MSNQTIIRKALEKSLRSGLERTVVKAREIAETAAEQALVGHSVGDNKVPDFFNEQKRMLRNRLRAHGRQLGDIREDNGEQSIKKLIAEVAYEHWHRMLFARFLEQNGLLMYDAHTPVTLQDCNDLVEDDVFQDELEARCKNGWELAGVLASKMLPQIFRTDSPVFQLDFALELQRELEALVMALPKEVFEAQDSLGWVYQFWQSKRKEEVNKSEVKIGADELSPVTQLFTEPYMVSFLLDNSLGAWWAGKRLSEQDWLTASSEQALREKAAIPGVPLEYLRFVKENERWQPASGFFEGWPAELSELKTLDPCCGSGHFLVAAFLMLVPIRMEYEGLSAKEAVDLVLSQNLHGLELDQRCVELAAFAIALEAWRYPDAGGYRQLPELQLACSGLSIASAKDEWKALSKKAGKQNLNIAIDWMYQTFKDAPVLGSLINPKRSYSAKIVKWEELDSVLADTLKQDERLKAETTTELHSKTEQKEAGIVAQGLVKAAKLLSMQYTWVITNVPYLARGKQHEILKEFCETYYPEGKNDLATAFLDRCLELCSKGGTSSVVLPQNWLFLTTYKKFREKLLLNESWNLLIKLGEGGFESAAAAGAFVAMVTISRTQNDTEIINDNEIRGIDVAHIKSPRVKSQNLINGPVKTVQQLTQLKNPDFTITLDSLEVSSLMVEYAESVKGLTTGDSQRFVRFYFEFNEFNSDWEWFQSTPKGETDYDGLQCIFYWQNGQGDIQVVPGARTFAQGAWGAEGVMIAQMRALPSARYFGVPYDNNAAVLKPKDINLLPALWCFASSPSFNTLVRQIDQKISVTNAAFERINFDVSFWQSIADAKYPNGLPLPYSNDPTQWIFHGHPCASVIWDEEKKWTVESEHRIDETVLQVAVARLLGYQWPAELDPDMELADEQRAIVERCKAFASYADNDGIVCIPAVWKEEPAELRLESILEVAYGSAWTANLKNKLLQSVGSKSVTAWLRDKFFEQHCKLFQQRPFIWHIWDGLKDGFSVLVNYHKLDKAGLERLIYTYLGDWIRTQQAGVNDGVDGADVRLAAAQTLKTELEKILEGEKPYDIFVRWKPLSKQPMGWEPDLNDGVRLNIRPFMLANDMGKKGAGVLRVKPSSIKWTKDRGTDVETAPWYHLGPVYGEKEGARINEHHLSLAEKQAARDKEA